MPPLRRQRSSARRIIARVIIYTALANLLYTLVTRAADLPAIARDALRRAPRTAEPPMPGYESSTQVQ